MAFVNLPPDLQAMFNNLQDQINKLLTGPNYATSLAESAQGSSSQASAEAAQAAIEAGQAQADAATALANATLAYNKAVGSLQPSADTIVNASNQMTAISTNGITVYSGSSATSGARVVMNSTGLAGYNSSGTATFSIVASTGTATFSGNVTGATITGSDLNINGVFTVNGSTGVMVASSATVTGRINATSGYFGTSTNGWSISSTGLTGVGTGSITGGTITGTTFTNGSTFSVSSAGVLTATAGSIGGWNISATKIYTGTVGNENQYLNSAGGGLLSGAWTMGSLGLNSDLTIGGNMLLTGSVTSANFNLSSSTEFRAPFAYSNTQANAANVWISSTGQLRRATGSSIEYKTDIVNLTDVPELNPKVLYNLPVRAFRFKDTHLPTTDDRSGVLVPGFIAQEIDEIYPVAADYEDGDIVNWNDKMITPALLALIQDLNNRVNQLEGK